MRVILSKTEKRALQYISLLFKIHHHAQRPNGVLAGFEKMNIAFEKQLCRGKRQELGATNAAVCASSLCGGT
jgi:hypothetical protein